jgi:hypothetical protein
MSELSLYKDNIKVSNNGVVVSKTGGGGVDGALSFLFDNNFGTKFGTSVPHEIIFAFPNAITMNQYKFATANDHAERDPISWRLSYSLNEGVDYTLLDSVVNFPTSIIEMHISLCISRGRLHLPLIPSGLKGSIRQFLLRLTLESP